MLSFVHNNMNLILRAEYIIKCVWEHVKRKIAFLVDASAKGGDRSPPTPPAKKCKFFHKIKKKCLVCFETREYANIFCEIFERVCI